MKVVFLDIDGTLVDYNGNVPESTKKAILQAKANGHKMVLCTGRSRFQIPKKLWNLGMEASPSPRLDIIVDKPEVYTPLSYLGNNSF